MSFKSAIEKINTGLNGQFDLSLRLVNATVALTYLSSFGYLLIKGELSSLVGNEGILPISNFHKMAWVEYGIHAFYRFPSLFWINQSDIFICLAAYLAIFSALALFSKALRPFASMLLYLIQLSFITSGGDFFHHIGDTFLIEITVLLALANWAYRITGGLPAIVVFCLRLFLLRFWFAMGMNKFYFGDLIWYGMVFFEFYFPNQPLPSFLSWYFSLLPKAFHVIATLLVFVSELIVPYLVLMGKRFRVIAFWVLALISIGIEMTGNYAYFNLLTIGFGFILLDDEILHGYFRRFKRAIHWFRFEDQEFVESHVARSVPPKKNLPAVLKWFCCFIIVNQFFYWSFLWVPNENKLLNHLNYPFFWVGTEEAAKKSKAVAGIVEVVRFPSYFRIANPYGVFKSVPYRRMEVIIEGSQDGEAWQEYELHYKVGALDRLSTIAPLFPRLDTQFFLEGHGTNYYQYNKINRLYNEGNSWSEAFLRHLLQGNTRIERFFRLNPFPDSPPEYVRCHIYMYEFNSAEERRQSGNYWKRVRLFTTIDTSKKPLEEHDFPIMGREQRQELMRIYEERQQDPVDI